MIQNRWMVLWCVVAAIFGAMVVTLGTEKTFVCWGITTTRPDFADARGITAAIESHRLGWDPLVENPRDPFGRPFNYPRVWLGLSRLGIDQSHTAIIGHGLICLFLLGLLIFAPPDLDWLGFGLLLPVAFSPASVLAMERGNSDLLMFFLMAIGIAGVAARRPSCKLVGVASVFLGFVLKLYPLFGFAMLLEEPGRKLVRRTLWIPVAAGLYVFLIRHDLLLIYQSTPKATGLSYGMNVLWMELAEHGRNLGIAARLLAWTGVAVAAGLAWVGHRRGTKDLREIPTGNKSMVAFRAGAGVYLGTFLLGNNWDYRLVFLIFTLPLLAAMIRGESPCQRRTATVVAAGIIVSCWHITLYHIFHTLPFGSPACVLLDEGANWTVFLGLSFLLGNTLVDRSPSDPTPAG
jgi:hypothetical protein